MSCKAHALGNIEKMYKRTDKIAKFHGISRKTAHFTENRPFRGPRHGREIAK